MERTVGNIPNLNLVGADDFESLLNFSNKDFFTVIGISNLLNEIEDLDQKIASISLNPNSDDYEKNLQLVKTLHADRENLINQGVDEVFRPSSDYFEDARIVFDEMMRAYEEVGNEDLFQKPEEFLKDVERFFNGNPKFEIDWEALKDTGLTGVRVQSMMDLSGMNIDNEDWMLGAEAIGETNEMAGRLLLRSEQMVDVNRRIAKAMKEGYDPQRIAELIRERQKLHDLTQEELDHINFWSEEFKEDFHGNMVEVLKGTKTVSEGFRGMFNSMIDHMLYRITKDVADAFYESVFYGKGGGIGNIFTAIFGIGLKSGGKVEGVGGPKGDKIPARLSAGEYVINAASTRKYLPLIEKINEGTLGFNLGGPVGEIRGQGLSEYEYLTMDLIKQFEGFAKKGLPDAFKRGVGGRVERDWNAPGSTVRGGWGSNTVTDPLTGMVKEVTRGMKVGLGEANADLKRRTTEEFLPRVQRQVGMDVFQRLENHQKAALGSIAYQWGSLPESIVEAVRSGSDKDVVNAILKTGENQVWQNRHMLTAGIYEKGMKIRGGYHEENKDLAEESLKVAEGGFQDIGRNQKKSEQGNFAVKTIDVGVKTTKDEGGDGNEPKPKSEDGAQPGRMDQGDVEESLDFLMVEEEVEYSVEPLLTLKQGETWSGIRSCLRVFNSCLRGLKQYFYLKG